MITSIIPKFLLEEESIIELQDMGIKLDEGSINLGKLKIPCIRVHNLTECEVFDKLETKALHEVNGPNIGEMRTFVSRNLAILFIKVRQVANMKDKDARCAATCALLASVNSLATIDVRSASRFLPMIRAID